MAESITLRQDPEGLVMRYLENPKDDVRDLIMVQYANMVERVARRFSGLEAYEDLVQVGFIGLLNALSKFDPDAGVRFNTYATYLVAGEIKHYLRDKSQTIRHPAWLQELRHKVKKSASLLQHTLGRLPTEGEIAQELGISETSVREVFQTEEMLKVASLDAPPQGEDESGGELDNLDAAAFCPEQLSLEDRLVLEQAMKQLRDLERQVLVHFHFDAMNQTEIASKLGISCNYVSHILRQSLSKLRKILSNEEDKDRILRREVAKVDYEVMDAVIECYTHEYIRARLEEELHRASCEGSAVAVIRIEFDGLDTLRSFYGEASVTDFLASAAEFLRENVRRLDVVGRFGDGGFLLLLPTTGPAVAVVRQRLLQRIGSWLSGRLPQDGPVQVKIGHACYPEDAKSAHDLLEGVEMTSLEELTHYTAARVAA